jgi:hypothetical protein
MVLEDEYIDTSKMPYDVLLYFLKVMSRKKVVPPIYIKDGNLLILADPRDIHKVLSASKKVIVDMCCKDKEKQTALLLSHAVKLSIRSCKQGCTHQAKLLGTLMMIKSCKVKKLEIETYSENISQSIANFINRVPLDSFRMIKSASGRSLLKTSYVLLDDFTFHPNLKKLDLSGTHFSSDVVFNNLIRIVASSCPSLGTLILPDSIPEDILSKASLTPLSLNKTIYMISMGIFIESKHFKFLFSMESLKELRVKIHPKNEQALWTIGKFVAKSSIIYLNVVDVMELPRYSVDAFLAMIALSKTLTAIHFDNKYSIDKSVERIVAPVNKSIKVWKPVETHAYDFIKSNAASDFSFQYHHHDSVQDDDDVGDIFDSTSEFDDVRSILKRRNINISLSSSQQLLLDQT